MANQTIATSLLILALSLGAAAAAPPKTPEQEQAQMDAFWAKERKAVEGKNPSFMMSVLKQEVEARTINIASLKRRLLTLTDERKAATEAVLASEEQKIAERNKEWDRLHGAVLDEQKARTEERTAAETQAKNEQESRSAERAKRIKAESDAYYDQVAREEREAAAAQARREEWAKANCGAIPANVKALATKIIKDNAHDPSSVQLRDCEQPSFTTGCWKVKCNFRGKNALGALVLQSAVLYMGAGQTSGKPITP